jgi:hypothetical protein
MSLAISIASIYYGFKLLKLYFKVKAWPKIKALVLSKSVVPKKLASGSRASKTILVEYSYQYNNQAYKNNMVFLVELLKGERGFMQEAGEKFLAKINNEIEIHVNPVTPQTSLIYCTGFIMYLFMVVAGFIILLSGLVYFLSH